MKKQNNNDYVVKIPKKFRDALIVRFSPSSLTEIHSNLCVINEPCPLCNEYADDMPVCQKCPFGKFRKKDEIALPGCFQWLKSILPKRFYNELRKKVDIDEEEIAFFCDKKKAKKILKTLKEFASKYIEFV